MSQWRIKGYVADSDEEDDLDFDDSFAQRPLATRIASVDRPGVAAVSGSDDAQTPRAKAAIPLGSQDELSLDSSPKGLPDGPRLLWTIAAPDTSPRPRASRPHPPRGSHASPSDRVAYSQLPVSSNGTTSVGRSGSENVTESSTNALSGRFLATQLFSDERHTSPPSPTSPSVPRRLVTPTLQEGDIDELQQGNGSAFSSPLSDARSDIERPDYLTSSPPPRPSSQQAAAQQMGGPGQAVQVVIPPQYAVQIDEAIAEEIRMSRGLRKRNPIQLHPYLLEAQKYKENLKARGLKPVNIAPESYRHQEKQEGTNNGESQELDSQDRDFVVDHTQSSNAPCSSPVGLPSSPLSPERTSSLQAQANHVHECRLDDDDEDVEFPDLSVLLRRKHDDGVQEGFKRRKILHTFSKKGSGGRASSLRQPANTSTLERIQQTDASIGIPPSPPTSEALPNPNEQYRRPNPAPLLRQLSPIRLQPPTPATSSTRKPIQTRPVDSESDPDDEPPISTARYRGPQRTASATIVASESESSGSSESDDSRRELEGYGIEQAKRRIKGVLPASWLRLDQKTQANRKSPPQPLPRQRQASGSSSRLGSAESSSAPRQGSPAPLDWQRNAESVVIEDGRSEADSDFAFSNVLQPRRNLEAELGFGESFEDAGGFDVQEHDWIDPMLPSVPRQTTAKKSGTKRQTKLTDAMPTRTDPRRLDRSELSVYSKVAQSRKLKPKASGGQRLRHTARRSAPELSILDAPLLNEQAPAKVPQFLKIAARQARRQPNSGRHSPTNKLIRLRTEADTEDANTTLREWRVGKIKRSIKSGPKPRTTQPLRHDQVVNQRDQPKQQYLLEPEKLREKNDLRIREDTSGLEYGGREVGLPRLRQTVLNLATEVKDTSSVSPSKSRRSKPKLSIARRPAALRAKLKQTDYRTTQLERPENEHESQDRAATFRRKLSQLDRMYANTAQVQFRDAWRGQFENPRLARYLQEDDEIIPFPSGTVPSEDQENRRPPPKPRRRLKANAQRVDTETREFRQPSDPIPRIQERLASPPRVTIPEVPRLEGFEAYGTRYPTDFDVSRLWSGTFFHESTMIGSGDFPQALKACCRDMDAPAGLYSFRHDGAVLTWGSWTEEVASEMECLLSSVVDRLNGARSRAQGGSSDHCPSSPEIDLLCLLRGISRYFSTHLHFLDPVDRRSFVSRIQVQLNSVSTSILVNPASSAARPQHQYGAHKVRLRLLVMLSLLALQVSQVAEQQRPLSSGQESTDSLFMSLVRPALQSVLRGGMDELRNYIDENRRHTAREQGIRDDKAAIEAVVMIHHMLLSRPIPQRSFWDLVKDEWTSSIANFRHVQSFERLWYDVFVLLPYLEIDSSGLVKPGHDVQSNQRAWSAIVPLMTRLFALYPEETAPTKGASVDVYVRSCLIRCYNLVHAWKWKRCNSLLTSIFDFFSRRRYTNLEKEESKGSPRFLEDLHKHPRLDVQPNDSAFHIFLKILAVGLKKLQQILSEREVRNVTYRLVPNHRRTYPKDKDLEQKDLDGLRNQHDLFCTLYWALSPGFRPDLKYLRDAVDQETSHREVCRLGVRAWSNLVRFQISTTEGSQPLEPLADWFAEILSQNMSQYKKARPEAESQFATARLRGNEGVSTERLQMIVKNNQAQIMATLGDAVYGMKAATTAAHDEGAATTLLSRSSIAEIFHLFDAKNTQTSKLITEVLDIFQVYLRLVRSKRSQEQSQKVSDDSQDYGSGFSLEDVEPPVQNGTGDSPSSLDFLHDAVWQLVSSCFEAETTPEDALLTKTVETWTMIAHAWVCEGQRGWSSFLDLYHPDSWRQLQNTEQTRRYTALFMAMVLDRDPRSYDENRDDLFQSWIMSLVERESTLKFQHRLTTSLINRDPSHPLLRNLPFLVDPRSGRVDIKLPEFRQRRLSLISSVLSNMRDDYAQAVRTGRFDVPEVRRRYSVLIKQFMGAMKTNYADLGHNTAVRGAYVDFVHKVVEFLQQHTQDICPVDPFFTDSGDFPLPAADPSYVVGKFKGYVPKLMEQKTLKQLVFFVQNVSERAAGDNEQESLISQLYAATAGVPEQGDVEEPSLRQAFLCAIFPAYIEQAFRTTAGWVLAKPLLCASRLILADLEYQRCQYSASDTSSVAVVNALLSTMLDAMHAATEQHVIAHPSSLDRPHVLHMLALVLDAVAATVLPAAHLHRRTRGAVASAAVQRIDAFRSFSLFVASVIVGGGDDPDRSAASSPHRCPVADLDPLPDWPTTRKFVAVRELCARGLATTLESGIAVGGGGGGSSSSSRWAREGDCYFLIRNGERSAVRTGVGSLDEERARVVHAIEEFHARLRLALWWGEEDVRAARMEAKRGRWPVRGGQMVVI